MHCRSELVPALSIRDFLSRGVCMTLYCFELEGRAVGYGDCIGNADDMSRIVGQNSLNVEHKFDTVVCRWPPMIRRAELRGMNLERLDQAAWVLHWASIYPQATLPSLAVHNIWERDISRLAPILRCGLLRFKKSLALRRE